MSSTIMFVVPYSMVYDIKPNVSITKSFGLSLRVCDNDFARDFDVSTWHCGSLHLDSAHMQVVDPESFHFTTVFVAEFSGLFSSVRTLMSVLESKGIPYYTDALDPDAEQYFKQSYINLQPAYSLHCKSNLDQEVLAKHWAYSEHEIN